MGDIGAMERVQKRAVRQIVGLKGKTYEEKLKEIGLESLESRRDRYDMVETYKILNNKYNVCSELWFKTTGENSARETRQSAYEKNLVHQRYNLDIRKYCFSARVTTMWNNLPTTIKQSPTIKSFKNAQDNWIKS